MRRIEPAWPPDFSALHAAWQRASAGKRRRPDVAVFEVRLLERLVRLADALAAGRWAPGGYRRFDVIERGKVRQVAAAPFVDRVVHHAVVDALAPVWEARFLPWSCANRVGRGTHDAMTRARAAATRFRFALCVDVFRFFPSVDHGVLKTLLRRHAKGPVLATWPGHRGERGGARRSPARAACEPRAAATSRAPSPPATLGCWRRSWRASS